MGELKRGGCVNSPGDSVKRHVCELDRGGWLNMSGAGALTQEKVRVSLREAGMCQLEGGGRCELWWENSINLLCVKSGGV
jgi:hypothetical protein